MAESKKFMDGWNRWDLEKEKVEKSKAQKTRIQNTYRVLQWQCNWLYAYIWCWASPINGKQTNTMALEPVITVHFIERENVDINAIS